MHLLLFLFACKGNSNVDSDDTQLDGIAYLTAYLYQDGVELDWSVTVTGSDISYTGMTGDSIDVETDDNGETFVVDFGNEIGCDGQSINGDQMALSQTVDLADGDTLNVNASPFDYYEWDGALQCTAWDNWGETEYDVQDYTNEDEQVTCVDNDGDLEIGANKLHLSSGEPVVDDYGPVTSFEGTVNGLSLSFDVNGQGLIGHIDCIVVD